MTSSVLALASLMAMVMGVGASMNEIDGNYAIRGEPADKELMQGFYKRLALIDLQDVKRLQNDDEYRETIFPSDYRSDVENTYGDGVFRERNANGREEDEEDDDQRGETLVSDKSSDIIRDPELTQHSSNFGILHMTEEEKQRPRPGSSSETVKSLKSDDPLPFYCHPPNPCPKGYTSKDGCQEFIEDTADYQKEWIRQMQRKGICSCDEEHMFDCSSGNSEPDLISPREELDQVFDKFIKEKKHENPFTQGGQKRQSMVAKKSPRIKRDTRYARISDEIDKMVEQSPHNPYLMGKRLPTVAKKGLAPRSV